MKKENQEIIAYRIGEGLFCPSCYEEGAKRLRAVQMPEDLQVTFPSKPIKAGDIKIFICEECKTIKGIDTLSEKDFEKILSTLNPREEKVLKMRLGIGEKPEGKPDAAKKEEKDFLDLLDMLDVTADKMAFLRYFNLICLKERDDLYPLDMNENESSGLIKIIDWIGEDIRFVSDRLQKLSIEGKIIDRSS